MQENSLTHYGILGQHWGKRRFETKDGYLTAAGKQRYKHDKKTLKKLDKNEKGIKSERNRHLMRLRMRKNIAIRKKGDLKKLRNKALLLGGTALAAYSVGKNMDKGYSKDQLIDESLKTGKGILKSGEKKAYKILKDAAKSEQAKKIYAGTKTVLTSKPAKKIYKGAKKVAAKVVKASGTGAKFVGKKILEREKDKYSLTKDFDRDDISTYGSVFENLKANKERIKSSAGKLNMVKNLKKMKNLLR